MPRTLRQFSFTTAGDAIAEDSTSWKRLRGIDVNDADLEASDQYVRITAQSTANGAAGILAVALVHSDLGVLGYFTADVSPTARRMNLAGTGGNYVCDVLFDRSLSEIMDLAGAADELEGGGSFAWYIGVADMGGLTALNVQAHFGKTI